MCPVLGVTAGWPGASSGSLSPCIQNAGHQGLLPPDSLELSHLAKSHCPQALSWKPTKVKSQSAREALGRGGLTADIPASAESCGPEVAR